MLLPKVLHTNMCRSHRQRKMSYLLCRDRGCTILFSCPFSQTARHGGRNPMVQLPGRLRPDDCWSPGAEASLAIQGDFVSKTSKPTHQPQTCFKEFSFCQGGDGKLLEGKKNLQTTQISFVKCFETVLRIAAQILQSNKRKTTVLSQFSVRGRKDFTPVGGHAVNGHQQRVRRQQVKTQSVTFHTQMEFPKG